MGGATTGSGVPGTGGATGPGTGGGTGLGTSVGTSLGTGGAAGSVAGAAGAEQGECTLDEVGCDDLIPQRCSALGTWVATRAACAVACHAGECVACAEGDRECRNGAVQECEEGNWSTVQVCGNTCEEDACVATCTEERYQCNGDRWLQKCTNGEYVDDTECEFLCQTGACSGECMPDTRRCNPGADNESQGCNAQGQWDQSTSCSDSDTFCVKGDCKPCSPGTTQCSESGPQLCSEDGEWVNQGACTSPNAACFDGGCVLCQPGDKRCSNNAVEQCLPDGSAFAVLETCSGDNPACLESTKTCGKCSEGDSQCLDDEVQICDAAGAWQTDETCSGTTPQCVDSLCRQCDPLVNERRCQTSSKAQGCSPDGSWSTADNCTGDTPICRPDLNFVCGCEEGEHRCRNSTVPEVCQGGAWVAQAACAGVLNYCLPETGECVDCVPDATECRSGVAHECNDDGAWQSLNSCSGPDINCAGCDLGEDCGANGDCDSGFCVNGVCAECEPDQRTCQGNTPQLCLDDGSWQNQSTCSGNTPACAPSTGQCVQCLSGSRSCGNCNLGTQTCSNNSWGTCVGAPDLQTDEDHCGSCTNDCGSDECIGGQCRAPDGDPCSTDDDCISDICTTYYFDNDNDSFGSAASGTQKICGVTSPGGNWRTNDLDCCNTNAEANPDYDEGPRDYGAEGPQCAKPFDWNCDGVETKTYAFVGSSRCEFYTSDEDCPGAVMVAETACGDQGDASLCGWTGTVCSNARGGLLTQTCY